VLESAAPYEARDLACGGPFEHPYKIISWHYVNSSYGIPSVSAIKQAIYDHGPVAAAVCVGPAFQTYARGVFQTNESSHCNGGVNHAIVLVGWDEDEQTWILRNSWGPGWGEGGYMRIRYGTSNVGYAANYVIYPAAPPLILSNRIYLPTVMQNNSTTLADGRLVNGDLEHGNDGSWTEYSSNDWTLVLQSSSLPEPTSPHGGNWAAWLGGDNDETAILSQQVTVPSNATTLDYWYWSASEDLCGYDYARIQIGSSTLKTHDLCESSNTGGWTHQQVSVGNWRGQTVELRFFVETDWLFNSNFFLDDISFSAVGASTDKSVPPDSPESPAIHPTTQKSP
jgi:hypothetical protein